MHTKLFEVLLQKNGIQSGTEVDAIVKVPIFGRTSYKEELHHLMITKITKSENYIIDVSSTIDGRVTTISELDILTLDGMDPIRYAELYNIKVKL